MNIEEEIESLKQRILALENLLGAGTENAQEKVETKQKDVRDKTRFMYGGKIYPKNRLVLAIVLDYVKNNNPTFDELCEAFDKSLQGSLGVVQKLEDVLKIKDSGKRFFTNDVIDLKDGTKTVVCTQWGIFNIVKFVKQARNLGYPIEEFVMTTLF